MTLLRAARWFFFAGCIALAALIDLHRLVWNSGWAWLPALCFIGAICAGFGGAAEGEGSRGNAALYGLLGFLALMLYALFYVTVIFGLV